MLTRRALLAGAVASVAAPLAAEAEQAMKLARIGYLGDSPIRSPQLRQAFVDALRDLGYVEGRNLIIEYRYVDGRLERFPHCTAELIASNVDIIFAAGGTPAALAAKEVTTTVPIVFPAASDPVASGLVDSLARPGGNATGLTFFSHDLIGKCFQLVKEAVPSVGRVALLWQPGDRAQANLLKGAEVAARDLRLGLHFIESRGPTDFDRAFAETRVARADALVVSTGPLFFNGRRRLTELAAKSKLPTVFPWREGADAGGLMSYGPSIPDLFKRAATYVDRILKGAKPGQLPVEQPVTFEFVINMKTAKALGLTVPPSLLLRADQVIE